MKQIIQSYRTGNIELKEVPAPLCKDKGLIVKTENSLVSVGTEKSMIGLAKRSLLGKAKSRPDLVKQVMGKIREQGIAETINKVFVKLDSPVALGYSCSGEIVEVGKCVNEFKVGDRVACGGVGYASHAGVNFVPKNLCVKIPENVDFEEASFVTLGAIAIQGVRRCELSPGEKVGVIGLGLVGQLTVQILKSYGFCVLGMDIDEEKVNKTIGLDRGAVVGKDNIERIADPFSSGYGLDAVIITASADNNAPVDLAGRISRKRGRISVVGAVDMSIPRDVYYKKELDLRMSCSYGPGRYDSDYEEKGKSYPYSYVRWTERRNMEEFLRLINIGRINVKDMITHRFFLKEYKEAYRLVLDNPGKEYYMGILLRYNDNSRNKSTIVFNNLKQEPKGKYCFNIGIIGVGLFAKNFILPNLKRIKSVNIKAIAADTGKSAESIAGKYKCSYSTTDYHKILDDTDIDAVFIATRHNLHARMVIEALEKDKHVFVEKPLCLNETELKDIGRILYQGSKSGKPCFLTVGFNRRFSPAALRTKKKFSNCCPLMINYRVNAGHIPLTHWVHDLEEGGGRIIGEVCHFVDLLQFLTGALPVRIFASGIPLKEAESVSDNLTIVIDFSDGSRGSILYTAVGEKTLSKEYIEIFGAGRCMVIDDFKKRFSFGQDKGHAGIIRAFVSSVLGKGSVPIFTDSVLLSMLSSIRIQDSLRDGVPVKVDLSQIINV